MEPISIIVAVDEGGGFGKNGKIPWKYSEDMKHFQKITKGGICVMGRRTYEDMLKMRKLNDSKKKNQKPINEILPGRKSLVVTSSSEKMPGAITAISLRTAIEDNIEYGDKREVFILGGYRMFVEALVWANKIYITLVPGYHDCDVSFPLTALKRFKLSKESSKEGELKFLVYTK